MSEADDMAKKMADDLTKALEEFVGGQPRKPIVIAPQVMDFGELRNTGQTAFDAKAGGAEMPADIPDHAQLWASGMEVSAGCAHGDAVTRTMTCKNARWFVPELPKDRAPPIPDGYMESKPIKAADISDRAVLEFLAKYQGRWSTWDSNGKHMPCVSAAMPPGTHRKLQLAKMRSLVERGLSGGCTCGCRGDWEITDRGLAYIGQPRTQRYNGY